MVNYGDLMGETIRGFSRNNFRKMAKLVWNAVALSLFLSRLCRYNNVPLGISDQKKSKKTVLLNIIYDDADVVVIHTWSH